MVSQAGVLGFAPGSDADAIMEVALEAGAEDVVVNDDGSIEVLARPDQFAAVKAAFVKSGRTPELAEITMRASTTTTLEGDEAQKLGRLLDMLEELDDTQNVHCNADFADEALES